MPEPSSVQRILIVGGGTAGWMSAVHLSRAISTRDTRITVVESPHIGTVGVGEATVPAIVEFVRRMKWNEDEFMRACHATYKLGIRFDDWLGDGTQYWHPFGICGGMINGRDLFHFWTHRKLQGRESAAYSDYSLQARVAESALAPRLLEGSSPITASGAYAWHIDSSRLAEFLKADARKHGVEHIQDEVEDVRVDDDGFIESVQLRDHGEAAADLFIDCSGFHGLLIEDALGDPYVDWNDVLLCDRAAVVAAPVCSEFAPFTRATALSAGWAWQIPLIDRQGCGYAFSSRHIDDDAAANELRRHAGLAETEDVRFLRMRVGRRSRFWSKNCVAVGLASGFIEPLESTGILLIQRALELLTEFYPDRQFSPSLRDAYNSAMSQTYDQLRDFIQLHYLLNQREDAVWVDSRSAPISDSLQSLLNLYDEAGHISESQTRVFTEASWYHILAGSGRLPRRTHSCVALGDDTDIDDIFLSIVQQNSEFSTRLPPHRTLLDRIYRSV